MEVYKPGYQVDGAAGIIYNNLYNVMGFDKIAPLVADHRVAPPARQRFGRRSR